MKNVTSLLMLITSVMTNAALAAETTSPNPERKAVSDFWESLPLDAPELIVGDTVSIRPGSPYYSASVAETGAQGRVILLLDLSKDGKVEDARVHTSSRSDALDAAAIRKALTMSYQGRGAPPAAVSLKVDFRRDRADTLSAKSCREFNVDVAWFRKAFPSSLETDMPTIHALGNLVRLNYGSADRWLRTPILNAVPFAQCAVVTGCAANPDARLGEVFNRAMREQAANPKSNEELCAFTRSSERTDEGLPRSLLQVDLDMPIRARTQYITPEMPAYPQQLVSSGVQGQVMVEATVTKQGQISDIRVTNNQSEVAALADAAIAYARHLPLSQAARADTADTIVIVPIHFNKDTEASIGSKTCADFNIDVAAYTAIHPKVDLRTMNVVLVAQRALLDQAREATRNGGAWQAPMTATAEDLRMTAELCKNQPQAKFMDVFQEQMRSTQDKGSR